MCGSPLFYFERTYKMINIEQYLKVKDTTQMENMLQMIDPQHGIIIDDKVGLLGEFESDDAEELALQDMRKKGYDVSDNQNLARLNDKHSMYKRGQYFRVIDTDGCFLFDEYVTESGIIYRNNEPYGYIFILKDYKASQVFDIFFDDEAFCPAVILYIDNKLYINNVQDKELMKKFNYKDDIKIEFVKQGEYRLEIDREIYYSYNIDGNNMISIYKTIQMQL